MFNFLSICYNTFKQKSRKKEKAMSLESEFTLSFYKEVAMINEKHQVSLVQHVESRKLYVKKIVSSHNLEVYQILKREHFASTPAIRELIAEDDHLIIIEEYISGQTLEEILSQRLFSEEETRQILMDLCQTLKPLHDYDPPIIHRDIKPSNLILDSQNHLYLVDFDASKNYDPAKSRDTVLMGTEDYAAPEQYGFLQSSEKTDIFSIGVLANKMLTGSLPSAKRPQGAFGGIIEKCLSMDPADRFPSVTALSAAIAKAGQKSYALPGFRKRSIKSMMVSGVWYLFLLTLTLSMEIEDAAGVALKGLPLYLNRAGIGAFLFLWTLYFSNYCKFRDRFPFQKKQSLIVNLFRMVLGAFLLVAIPACIVAVIQSLL